MDVPELRQLVSIPKFFDARLVNATREGEAALWDLLALIQTSGLDDPDAQARVGWLLFQVDADEQARELLARTPGLLARGYLARVQNSFLRTEGELRAHLSDLQRIPRVGESRITDFEGLAHLELACARLLVSLGEAEKAPRHYDAAVRFAEMVQVHSVPPNVHYQMARAAFGARDYAAAAKLMLLVSQSSAASQFMLDAASELLFWSCVLGGVPMPEGAPEPVRVAFGVLLGEDARGVEGMPQELRDVCDALVALRKLLDFVIHKFPVARGPRVLKRQRELLSGVLAFREDEGANGPRNTLIQCLRVLALAVTGGEAAVREAEGLLSRPAGPVLSCLVTCTVLQASAWAQQDLLPAEKLFAFRDFWRGLNHSQRHFVTLWVWDFCPSVPFILDGVVHFNPSKRPIAVVSEVLRVNGDIVQGFPVTAANRYIQGFATGDDLELLADHRKALKGVYRVDFELLSGMVRKRVLNSFLELDSAGGNQ